jgi:hypothetical protein
MEQQQDPSNSRNAHSSINDKYSREVSHSRHSTSEGKLTMVEKTPVTEGMSRTECQQEKRQQHK